MSAPLLQHLAYEWRGRQERIVRIGGSGPAILFLPPFFEEANRTRHFLIETMRGLAARGHDCFLPDLPGTIESLSPLSDMAWADWTGAVSAVRDRLGTPFHSATFRGGALLDGSEALSHWRLTPADGRALLRDLVRVRMAADREDGAVTTAAAIEEAALSKPFDVAGYTLAPSLLSEMRQAQLTEAPLLRTVRLETDAQPASIKIAGQPLWRRSEPGHDPVLSQLVVEDIADWIASCENG